MGDEGLPGFPVTTRQPRLSAVERMERRDARKAEMRCSFCGKRIDHTRAMVAGQAVAICDECVALCVEIMEKKLGPDWWTA